MIYSIGCQKLPFDRLLSIMEALEIGALLDVRSKPGNRPPEYAPKALTAALGPRYTFVGDDLPPAAIKALAKEARNLLLMGTPEAPGDCHRHHTIARAFWENHKKSVHHIYQGEIVTAPELERAIGAGKDYYYTPLDLTPKAPTAAPEPPKPEPPAPTPPEPPKPKGGAPKPSRKASKASPKAPAPLPPPKAKPSKGARVFTGEVKWDFRNLYAGPGYFTDGHCIIKGEAPKPRKKADPQAKPMPPEMETRLSRYLPGRTAKGLKAARILEFLDYGEEAGQDWLGTGPVPLPDKGWGGYCIMEAGGVFYAYQTRIMNAITNRHAPTEYRIDPGSGLVVAYQDGEPIASAMPTMMHDGARAAYQGLRDVRIYDGKAKARKAA